MYYYHDHLYSTAGMATFSTVKCQKLWKILYIYINKKKSLVLMYLLKYSIKKNTLLIINGAIIMFSSATDLSSLPYGKCLKI